MTFTRGEVEALFPRVPVSLLRSPHVFGVKRPRKWMRFTTDDLERAQWIQRQLEADGSVVWLHRLSRVVRLGPGCTSRVRVGDARLRPRRRACREPGMFD